MSVIVKYEEGPLHGKIRAYSRAYPELTVNGASQATKCLLGSPSFGSYKPKDRKRKGFGTFENPLIYIWVPNAKVSAVPQQTV